MAALYLDFIAAVLLRKIPCIEKDTVQLIKQAVMGGQVLRIARGAVRQNRHDRRSCYAAGRYENKNKEPFSTYRVYVRPLSASNGRYDRAESLATGLRIRWTRAISRPQQVKTLAISVTTYREGSCYVRHNRIYEG